MVSEDSAVDDSSARTDSVASMFLIVGRRPEVGFAVVERAMVVCIVVVVKEKIRAVVAKSTPRDNII